MDEIAKGNSIDIGRNDFDTPGTSGSSDLGQGRLSGDWNNDRNWWQGNFATRPYVSADRRFEDYEPGYRFGYESANRYR